jgi:cbb3-type cytochrome c oxidase subunit I
MTTETITKNQDVPDYNYEIVRMFVIATCFWGVVGMMAGVFIATQLAFPDLNVEPYLNFGRLRPLHTSAVIFAFGGNALFATSYYVVQRTCRARLWGGDGLAKFTFWGYQAFIVIAAVGYVLGVTQGKEYAEPEWYADLWLTIVWVVYLLIFMMTVINRKEPHLYVANWFYLAFIITVAVLHLGNNVIIPVEWLGAKSYSVPSGVQSAMIQWWYGHNAVGFFLTAGFLGMMYYFRSKTCGTPGLFVPACPSCSLLVADLYLHLGRPAPPALHGAAGLGADAGNDVLHHAVDAELGRDDQRDHDPVRGVGKIAQRPGDPVYGRGACFLRNEYL